MSCMFREAPGRISNEANLAAFATLYPLRARAILASATSMPREAHTSIWFFIGLILTIYGVLILGASLHDLAAPPEHPVVLANLHAGIWWGVLLVVLGVVYTFVFAPWRKKRAR